MIIEFASSETHALAVIADACAADQEWMDRALPDPVDQLAVRTALAKLREEQPVATRLGHLVGNRGGHHRELVSLRYARYDR
jgi:hypothetical protein